MNRGRYCPVYNPMGTYKDTASKNWYETTFPITSTYSAFQNIGTAIGRPDGKSDKYIYSENFIDKRTNAEKANIPQLLNEVHNGAVNGSLGGYSDNVVIYAKMNHTLGYGNYSSGISSNAYLIYNADFPINTNLFALNVQTNIEVVIQVLTGVSAGKIAKINHSYKSNGTYYSLGENSTIQNNLIRYTDGTTIGVLTGETVNIIAYTKAPITSYKTSLTTDVIGSPANYPSMMKDRLASGKPLVGINPLLVGQDGEDYVSRTGLTIYGTNSIFVRNSKKNTIEHNKLVLEGGSWIVMTQNIGVYADKKYYISTVGVSNATAYGFDSNEVVLSTNTSSNPVANISTPKAVQQVGNYAVATNSHSIYKGNNLTQLLGKVAVGNGSNGLESKVVENIGLSVEVIEIGIQITVKVGEIVLVGYGHTDAGKYYKRLNSDVTFTSSGGTVASSNWQEVAYWKEIITIPTHSTIALDNSNSPAIKTLSTIATADDGELLYQVLGEEGKLNTTWGFDTNFSQLTNGTLVDLNGATVRTIVATIGLGVYK